jgi:hypothetical protein
MATNERDKARTWREALKYAAPIIRALVELVRTVKGGH